MEGKVMLAHQMPNKKSRSPPNQWNQRHSVLLVTQWKYQELWSQAWDHILTSSPSGCPNLGWSLPLSEPGSA